MKFYLKFFGSLIVGYILVIIFALYVRAQLAPSVVSPIPNVKIDLVYWLEACIGPSTNTGALTPDLTQVDSRSTKNKTVTLLKINKKRYSIAQSITIGTFGGYTWRSVRGPQRLMDVALGVPNCDFVGTWTQARLLLPKATTDWLKQWAVCHGEATWNGQTIDQWPCAWVGVQPSFTVKTTLGFGPAISYGGNQKVAAGVQ